MSGVRRACWTELELVERVVTGRRTSNAVDPDREVPRELIDRLLRLIVWAPNHKRTRPWRMAVFSGRGRDRLAHLVVGWARLRGDDEARAKTHAEKCFRSPVIVLVGMRCDVDSLRRVEDRDAVAAGIQNLLLAATAARLASSWITPGWITDGRVRKLCGLKADEELVAAVRLGWPTRTVTTPSKPDPNVLYVERRDSP